MDKIKIQNIKTYAFHGVHEVETLVGQWYLVNIELQGDFSKAKLSNELSGTVDYSQVTELVLKEMAVPSKLIEHVAQRIVLSISENFPLIQGGKVEVIKTFPPVKGAGEVSITLEF